MAAKWDTLYSNPELTFETRDLEKDALNFLHGHRLMKVMSPQERVDSYELVSLTTNECFLHFEQVLLLAKSKLHRHSDQLQKVVDDELEHTNAFRTYNHLSRLSDRFYTLRNGQKILPGHRSKLRTNWLKKLFYFLIKIFPDAVLLVIPIFEYFSVECGKLLIKNHGTNNPDMMVRLHKMHLQDEVGHIAVCNQESADYLKQASLARKFVIVPMAFMIFGYLMLSSIETMKGMLDNLPSLNKNISRKTQFWLAWLGITDHKVTPFSLALKYWARDNIRWSSLIRVWS